MNAHEELLAILSKCSSLRDIREIIRLVGEQKIGDDTGHGQFSTNQLRREADSFEKAKKASDRLTGTCLAAHAPMTFFNCSTLAVTMSSKWRTLRLLKKGARASRRILWW